MVILLFMFGVIMLSAISISIYPLILKKSFLSNKAFISIYLISILSILGVDISSYNLDSNSYERIISVQDSLIIGSMLGFIIFAVPRLLFWLIVASRDARDP